MRRRNNRLGTVPYPDGQNLGRNPYRRGGTVRRYQQGGHTHDHTHGVHTASQTYSDTNAPTNWDHKHYVQNIPMQTSASLNMSPGGHNHPGPRGSVGQIMGGYAPDNDPYDEMELQGAGGTHHLKPQKFTTNIYRRGGKPRRGRRIMRNGGGTRSLHDHTYPNGPYGPSGNAITTGHPSTWGWGHNGQVVQPFHSSVQEHWGQYPEGYSYGEPGAPHYGYRHSSLSHNHQPKHLRRRPRPFNSGGYLKANNPYDQEGNSRARGKNPY